MNQHVTSEDYQGPGRRGDDTGRREDDTVISMLRESINRVSKTVEDHVDGCSKLHKTVLIIVCLMFIWLIAHSPEAAHLAAKAFPSFGSP